MVLLFKQNKRKNKNSQEYITLAALTHGRNDHPEFTIRLGLMKMLNLLQLLTRQPILKGTLNPSETSMNSAFFCEGKRYAHSSFQNSLEFK